MQTPRPRVREDTHSGHIGTWYTPVLMQPPSDISTQFHIYSPALMQPPSAKGPSPAKAPSPAPTKAPSPASGVRPSRNVKGSKVAPAPEEEVEVKKVEKTEVKKQVEIVNGTPPDRADGNWEPVSTYSRPEREVVFPDEASLILVARDACWWGEG